MKTNKKILIIVSVAAVLLVGLMLLLIFMPFGSDNGGATFDEGVKMGVSVDEKGVHQAVIGTNEKGEIENNSYGTLISYVPMDITKIHIENKKGTLDIDSYTPVDENGETQATVYTIVGFENVEQQAGMADSIANQAASIDFSKVMTLEKEKSKDYGFDDPRSVVTVTYTDDTKAVIYVGDNAPQGAGTYIKFGNGDEVYLVATDAVAAFDYGLTDLVSLAINDTPTNTSDSQASKIVISGTNFPQTIELVPNIATKVSASFTMKKPIEIYANENETSLITGAIRGLYANGVKMVNPSDAQLSELGLSKPYSKITATYPDATIELIASKPDGEGNVFVMEVGTPIVYTMASANLPWVTTSYESLVSEYVLYPKMVALSAVSVNNGKKTYDFKLSSTETVSTDDDGNETTATTTTVKLNNKELDLGKFQSFYQNLALVELADIESESVSGKPIFSAKYTFSEDNTSETVEYYNTGSNRYVAVVNGKVVGHAHKAGVNKLISEVEALAK